MTALFKNIWYVHCTISVWRVVQESCIQEYMLCTQCMESSARQLYSRIYLWWEMNLQGTSLCWGIPTRRIFT